MMDVIAEGAMMFESFLLLRERLLEDVPSKIMMVEIEEVVKKNVQNDLSTVYVGCLHKKA